jgi:hypothetical protein
MIARKPMLSLPLALLLIVAVHLSGMFALKAWRGQERVDEARGQAERIAQRLLDEVQVHANRQAVAILLDQAGETHPQMSRDEALRKLQEALALALPEARVETTFDAVNPGSASTSVGLTILPVSIRLIVPDTAVPESVRSIEEIRPGITITRVHIRQADNRRRGPIAPTPLAEITIQAALLVKGVAR